MSHFQDGTLYNKDFTIKIYNIYFRNQSTSKISVQSQDTHYNHSDFHKKLIFFHSFLLLEPHESFYFSKKLVYQQFC